MSQSLLSTSSQTGRTRSQAVRPSVTVRSDAGNRRQSPCTRADRGDVGGAGLRRTARDVRRPLWCGYAIGMAIRDDAPEEGAAIDREEAQAWFTRFLMRRVRRDEYPSTTQLDLIEKSIPREMLDEYLRVLVDKVAHDMFPSVPLLRRIQHLIERLPRRGYGHRQPRAEDDVS